MMIEFVLLLTIIYIVGMYCVLFYTYDNWEPRERVKFPLYMYVITIVGMLFPLINLVILFWACIYLYEDKNYTLDCWLTKKF